MKVRTDFVTNSSSSSFVLDLTATLKDGTTSSVHLGGVGEEDGESDVNFLCDAEDLLKAKSFEELRRMLENSYYDEDFEYADEDEDSEDAAPSGSKGDLKRWLDEIGKSVEGKLDGISRISFRRSWFAWGEGCSCFDCNMDDMAPGFREIAERAAADDASEDDVRAFVEYCDDFPGQIESEWGGAFPTGFMKCRHGRSRLVYHKDPKEMAKLVASGSIASNDDADEDVTVDFANGRTFYEGRYSLES